MPVVVMNEETFAQMKELLDDKFDVTLEKYISGSQRYLQTLEKAAQDSDVQLLADTAHPLKSSSRQIGADLLAELAQNIEHSARENQDVDYKKLVEQLFPALEQVETYIHDYMKRTR